MRFRSDPKTLMLLVSFVLYRPVQAQDVPFYENLPGPHTIEELQEFVLHDTARSKDLTIRVVYPREDGSYPVIYWGHKMGQSSRLEYDPLVNHWASHGYICILADHADSYLVGEEPQDEPAWRTRPEDISFVIDSLDEIEAALPGLAGKVDPDRIGVGGHMLGGGSADFIGGARSVNGDDLYDRRVSAVLLVGPTGIGQHLGRASWERCPAPRMVVLGTEARSIRTGNPWTWRADPYRLAVSEHKHIYVVRGADNRWGGIQGPIETEEHVVSVRSMGHAFFDWYLKGRPDAEAYLNRAPSVEVTTVARSGLAPLEVSFESAAMGGGPLPCHWELGDGTSSFEPGLVHTFDLPGVYSTMLTVFDGQFSRSEFIPISVYDQQVDQEGLITVDGLQRSYLLYLPGSYHQDANVPLLLVFHQGGTTATDISRITGFSEVAEREGFIVAYPNGIDMQWVQVDDRDLYPQDRNDIAFAEALVEELSESLSIDRSRVYASGMCMGEMISHRLAAEKAGMLAAVGVGAGNMAGPVAESFSPSATVPIIKHHGVADRIVPWGGKMTDHGQILSVDDTIAKWVEHNGCPAAPVITAEPDTDPDDGTTVERWTYGPCDDDSEVVLLAIEGGGHTWPGTSDPTNPAIGNICRDIDASQAIWNFLKRHRREQPIDDVDPDDTTGASSSSSGCSTGQGASSLLALAGMLLIALLRRHPRRSAGCLALGFFLATGCNAVSIGGDDAGSGDAGGLELYFQEAADYSMARAGASMLVMHQGEIVFDQYHNGHTADEALHLHSATKSFWGVAVAAMIDDGLISSYDELASDTITEWQGDARRTITVRQLLNLTSGLGEDVRQLQGLDGEAADKYGYAVTLPVVGAPGMRFRYGPSHFYAMGELIKRKLAAQPELGESTPLEYLDRRIFQPIGLQVGDWFHDPSGNPHIPNGAYLTARQWVRFGQLVAQDGRWDDQQLIPASGVQEVFNGSTANPGYGLTFWLNAQDGVGNKGQTAPEGAAGGFIYHAEHPGMAGALGLGTNGMFVFPSLDLLVVRQCHAPVERQPCEITGDTFIPDDFLDLLFAGSA